MTELDQYKAHVAMLRCGYQDTINNSDNPDEIEWAQAYLNLTPADSYEEVKKLRDEIAKLQSERDALKVAKDALNIAADKFHDYAEIHAAKEASPENDIKVERNLMLSSDMDKALAKINEVLKP